MTNLCLEPRVYRIRYKLSGKQLVETHNGVSAMSRFKVHFLLVSTLKLNMAALTAESLRVFPSSYAPFL
jgi:hypothetical protein